jgi:rhodanese-related sulfurtransferase
MKIKNLMVAISVVLVLFSGYATANQNANSDTSWQSKASAKVKKLLIKGGFEVVDTSYIVSKLGKGTRSSAKIILVDARPVKKYNMGHVPASYLMPDTKFEKFYSQIASMDKSKEIIAYCGGWKCVKSPKVALLLKAKGWKNIKVYQEGMPAWKKSGNYMEVDLPVVKSAVKKQNALIIDARPAKVYKKGHIPTSINIPDTKFKKYISTLPTDKNIKIITYCGGYKCAKSHKVAKELKKLGFKKVFVYAAGLPEWKKKGLEIEKAVKKVTKKTANLNYVVANGVQLVKNQEDNAGMVYGDFFKKVATSGVDGVVIVDVRGADEFKEGHIKGAANISFEDMKPEAFIAALKKLNKKVVLVCASGARATEAMDIVQENGGDVKSIFFADAVIDCDKNSQCSIEVNEPL